MSLSTKNFSLTKLQQSDPANIEYLNPNWDKIDDELFALQNAVTPITYGTTDLTAGTSELITGCLYFVYE